MAARGRPYPHGRALPSLAPRGMLVQLRAVVAGLKATGKGGSKNGPRERRHRVGSSGGRFRRAMFFKRMHSVIRADLSVLRELGSGDPEVLEVPLLQRHEVQMQEVRRDLQPLREHVREGEARVLHQGEAALNLQIVEGPEGGCRPHSVRHYGAAAKRSVESVHIPYGIRRSRAIPGIREHPDREIRPGYLVCVREPGRACDECARKRAAPQGDRERPLVRKGRDRRIASAAERATSDPLARVGGQLKVTEPVRRTQCLLKCT